MNSYTLHAP